ncbi:carbohydrate-binding domain-containing protein [Falsiroseomonas sp. CW058]|uniref:carbohydrate-binding domain-containing protein n=1 Tax=Falsiroseomonas sp. CW058 TaxID=3388664 RepID=UPI003D3140DC
MNQRLGSGPDEVLLAISQDAYRGDARYTVSIDGRQVGDVLPAGALRSLGETDTVTVAGNFGPGVHEVAVTFLNDAWGGSAGADRNLHVEGASFEGRPLLDDSVTLYTAGTRVIGTFRDAVPVTRTIGTGPDAILLRMSQDDWRGDARYTLSVDGVRVDGILTAGAERQFGQQDSITVRGDFGPGPHRLTVEFLNDAWSGSAGADRNLYVEGVSYNGVEVPGAALALYTDGAQDIAFGAGPRPPQQVTIGSGPDAVVLRISQDAFEGDARYTVSIDGVQVGGVLTAGALRSLGQADTVTVLGDFAPGAHRVTVDFLNDAWGGGPEADRNLYVEGASFEGQSLFDTPRALFTSGPQEVASFSEALSTGRGIGLGASTLLLRISQDDWLGNAEYVVRVDGVPVFDAPLSASSERRDGSYDTIYISRDFAPGEHSVTVEFLNDAWGGSADADRNLYVEGAALNGEALPGSSAELFANGVRQVATFTVPPPPAPVALTGTGGPDRLQETLAFGDVFTGNAGADAFAFGVGVSLAPFSPSAAFQTRLGTGIGPGERDVILDFQQGEDVIDLSAALRFGRRAFSVDDTFRFIGTAEFTGTAGAAGPPQLRYTVADGRTILQMDAAGTSSFSGDGTVDAEIELAGTFALRAADFIL